MKNNMSFMVAIIFASLIMVSCGQNTNKQKELELREREVALKEKEMAMKEKETINLKTDIKINKNDTAHVAIVQNSTMKTLILMSPTYSLGDLPHITFKDYTTHKEEEYECNWDLPAIQEIMTKCEGHDGCPALKNNYYKATLKLKLKDAVEYDPESGQEKPTGKKVKRWIMTELQKIKKP